MDFGRYDRIVEHYASQWPLIVPGYASLLATLAEVRRLVAVLMAFAKPGEDLHEGLALHGIDRPGSQLPFGSDLFQQAVLNQLLEGFPLFFVKLDVVEILERAK